MCLDYPIINYTVSAMMLGSDSENGALVASGRSNTTVNISGLVPDSRYLYTVRETNEFGTSNASAPVEIGELLLIQSCLL